ncbi:MAG: hypothetical protein DI570_05775 [Phenylobacterium zucineum]|nr:MAG: hypothetical protein DI570_05775 [Phenylobacterium zucineum]
MAWTKSPPSLIALFDVCLPRAAGLERRRMFGYPAAFAGGHMMAGLFQDEVFARLPPGLRAELDAEYGVRAFEPMPGRPMTAYTVLPEAVLDDEGELARVLAAAYGFTSAMPPKPPKARKSTVRSSRVRATR